MIPVIFPGPKKFDESTVLMYTSVFMYLQAKVGDCIDLIKEKGGSHNTVQRIRVLDIVEGKSKSGNTKVMLRLWKKAFQVEIS